MLKKTVLITGVSRGIGFALANQFNSHGYNVIGTSRTGLVPDLISSSIKIIQLDITDTRSIKQVEQLLVKKSIKIDILINNAAIGPDLDVILPNEKTFQQTFDTNVTGTVFFTELMISHLTANGKIINISSKMGSIEACTGTDSIAYRMSKTALNMYSKIVSNRLKGKQTVATIHPGWVRTDLTKGNVHAPLSPEESALSIFKFIESDYPTGVYWDAPESVKLKW